MSEQMDRFLLKEPYYGSQLDERALFQWVQAIPGVISVRGVPGGLEIIYNYVNYEEFVREILSLYSRYDLNFSELNFLINKIPSWVLNPSAYWYDRLVASLPNLLS